MHADVVPLLRFPRQMRSNEAEHRCHRVEPAQQQQDTTAQHLLISIRSTIDRSARHECDQVFAWLVHAFTDPAVDILDNGVVRMMPFLRLRAACHGFREPDEISHVCQRQAHHAEEDYDGELVRKFRYELALASRTQLFDDLYGKRADVRFYFPDRL